MDNAPVSDENAKNVIQKKEKKVQNATTLLKVVLLLLIALNITAIIQSIIGFSDFESGIFLYVLDIAIRILASVFFLIAVTLLFHKKEKSIQTSKIASYLLLAQTIAVTILFVAIQFAKLNPLEKPNYQSDPFGFAAFTRLIGWVAVRGAVIAAALPSLVIGIVCFVAIRSCVKQIRNGVEGKETGASGQAEAPIPTSTVYIHPNPPEQ